MVQHSTGVVTRKCRQTSPSYYALNAPGCSSTLTVVRMLDCFSRIRAGHANDHNTVGMLPVHDRVLTSESKEPAPPLQTPLADAPMPLNPANATDSLAKFLQAMPTQQLEASGDISHYTDNNGAALQEKEGRI